MNEPAHVAVVLAAGGSRRLGQPKQLLRRDGETLVHRAVRLARATAPRRVLVVTGAYREDIGRALLDLECERVGNDAWQQGMSGSLRAAQRALAGSEAAVLLLGCDQPALELVQLSALLALAARAASGCAATAYADALGMPAVVSAQMLQASMALQGDRGLRAPLNALGRDRVGVLEAAELALDLDTPEDVRVAIERGVLDGEAL